MRYDINPKWNEGALPLCDAMREQLPDQRPLPVKCSPRARLAIIMGSALTAWLLFLLLGWAVLAAIRTILGH